MGGSRAFARTGSSLVLSGLAALVTAAMFGRGRVGDLFERRLLVLLEEGPLLGQD